MRRRIVGSAIDTASGFALGLGVVLLLLPIALHLWVGADDDSYFMIVEYGRDPVILLDVGLDLMYTPRFLLWPGLLVAIGLGLRSLVWRWSPWVPSQSPADQGNLRWHKKTVTGMLGLTLICTALVLATGCASQAHQGSDTPTSVPTATPYLIQYRSAELGFAVEYPSNWEVYDLVHGPCTDDPNRLCDAVLFQTSDDFGNSYGVTVFRHWPAMGETITDTVEYGLRTLAPGSREQIKTRCCPTVDGEPAMELIFPPLPEDRLRDRQLSVVHNGGEYALIFWWNVPFQPAGVFDIPEGSAAEAAFDTFLRSFTFIPISETPTPPPPVPTPVPTPTWTPTPTSSLTPGSTQLDLRPAVQSV